MSDTAEHPTQMVNAQQRQTTTRTTPIVGRNIWIAACVAVLIVGTGLRFYNLGLQSLWSDELYSAAVAVYAWNNEWEHPFERKVVQQLTGDDGPLTWLAAEISPPLYYLLLRLWTLIFGTSDVGSRSLSAVLGAAAIWWAFIALRKRLNSEALFYFVAMMALSFSAIRYSQEARTYSLCFAATTLFLTELVRRFPELKGVSSEDGSRWRPPTGLELTALLLLCYSHYEGVVLAVMFSAYYALAYLRQRRFVSIGLLTLPGLALIPWMYLSFHAIRATLSGRMAWPGFSKFAEFPVVVSSVSDFIFPGFGKYVEFALLAMFVFTAFRLMWPKGKEEGADKRYADQRVQISFVLLVIFLLYFLIAFRLAIKVGFFDPRYFVIVLPIIYLVLSLWSERLPLPRNLRALGVTALLLASLAFSLRSYYIPHKEQYREAAHWIARRWKPGDVILATWAPNEPFYLHYLRKFTGNSRLRLDMISFPRQAAEICQDWQAGNEKKVFAFYHNKHVQLIADIERRCDGLLHKEAAAAFIGLRVLLWDVGR